MPNFDAWLGSMSQTAANRAADALRRINEKPASLVFVRNGAAQAAQTVRVEYDRAQSTEQGAGAQSSSRKLIVFGVRDHPTVTNTNIQRGDRFAYQGGQFRVIDVIVTLGEVQASCEVQQ